MESRGGAGRKGVCVCVFVLGGGDFTLIVCVCVCLSSCFQIGGAGGISKSYADFTTVCVCVSRNSCLYKAILMHPMFSV